MLGTVSEVDKDTTPRIYAFSDPSSVETFAGQALTGEENANIEIENVISTYQADCTIPSGKYVNHVRWVDSTGVTYLDSFYFNYYVPDNVQGNNRCEQATITIE